MPRLHDLPGAHVTDLTGPRQTTGMIPFLPAVALLLTSLLLLDGCQAIKGIFEAGVGVGIAAVIFVLVLVGGIVAMMQKK